jgi:hypothetical protein
VGGSFGGDVLLPNVARGVTAAVCKTTSTVVGSRSGGGSGGDDVTLSVTVAVCKTGSAATEVGRGSCREE